METSKPSSLEYDRLTPDYGNFLFQEILPFVERNRCNDQLKAKPTDHLRYRQRWNRRLYCGVATPDQCSE